MATYRLIGGTFEHGYDAEGNKRIWRARNLPRVEPGGPVAGGGPPDPLWKDGDDIVKTNKIFKVAKRGQIQSLTLDQLHPGKFIVETTDPCRDDEDVFLTGYRRHSNHVPNPHGVMYVPAAEAARQQPRPVASQDAGQPKVEPNKPVSQQGNQQRKPEPAGAR